MWIIKKIEIMKKKLLIILTTTIAALTACSYLRTCETKNISFENLQISKTNLADFLEKNNNFIVQEEFPPVINATAVFSNLNKYFIIDIRSKEEYEKGHIPSAINVKPTEIIDFLKINKPFNYEKIVIVDKYGPYSVYVATLLRYIGFDKIFGLKYGMASWNKSFAKDFAEMISSKYEKFIDTLIVPKPQSKEYKTIYAENIYSYILSKVQDLLKLSNEQLNIPSEELFNNLENYFIVNYWPQKLYLKGHIKGAYNYEPKKDLLPSTYLYTLPEKQKILIYCYTSHTAAAITAYLRLLGYEAYYSDYSMNSFALNSLVKINPTHAVTNLSEILNNFPIEK